MIEFRQVEKRYGNFTAVTGLSFHSAEGRIIGLLGQNGAGKTTTLNMLTGFFPPTSGQVLIGGHDMLADPRACKRLIGYLPEQPPLYDEMTVGEFLTFASRLREVKENAIKAHTEAIMGLCGLTEKKDKLISGLSKGFRQRVGIAQALCGDPAVIVLDEPTIGLDPRQVIEIRSLIRRLGENHTVIFSSHILSEVQQLCDRVLILHKGRLVRDCDMHQVTGGGSILRLEACVAMKERELMPHLRSLSCLIKAQVLPGFDAEQTRVLLECRTDGEKPQLQLFRLLTGLNAPLLELTPLRDTLEDFFMKLTSGEEQA